MNQPEKLAEDYDFRGEAIRPFFDPIEYFDMSDNKMQAMPREQLTALQEEGLKYRFESLGDKVSMLEKLAGKQGINKLDSIEDVVPLHPGR